MNSFIFTIAQSQHVPRLGILIYHAFPFEASMTLFLGVVA